MSTALIGLSGYAGVGKDTVAAILAEALFTRVAFADTMRDALALLNPGVRTSPTSVAPLQVLLQEHGWENAKRQWPEIRRLQQVFGTEVCRALFGEDCWVKIGISKAHAVQRAVITDVRFPNEFAAIKASGGVVWRINRHGHGPVNAHPSETALDDAPFDWHIWNNGTVEDLRRQVLDNLGA